MSDITQKDNFIYLGLFLAALAAVAAACLAIVANLTAAPIKLSKEKETAKALKQVLPAFDKIATTVIIADKGNKKVILTINEAKGQKLLNPIRYYLVQKDGKFVAAGGESYSLKGYGGKITGMVGLLPNGKIKSIVITGHSETPGLGTKVTDRKIQTTIFDLLGMGTKKDLNILPPNKTLDQFSGHIATASDKWNTPWKVGPSEDKKSVDFITGATITSKAVTDIAYKIASTFIKYKKDIIAKLKTGELK